MSERFLYEDGLEISLSDAYTFIQGIANNRIRNLTRLITQSPGFLDESFETVALEKDASTTSTYYLKLKVGPVVFPNGEIFNGQEFVCRVAINKSAAVQYLKIVHMVMKRTAQDQAFGEESFAEEMDGVRLTLSENPDLADDGSELLIRSIKYLPDMHIPETEDLRDPWIFFWSASTIVNPLEAINVDEVNIHSSKSLWSNDINILNSPDFNSECSTIINIPQEVDSARHAWDILVKSEVSEISKSVRNMEPYPVSSGKPNVIIRLPQGLEANLLLRKNDAYRDISTEWGESGKFVVSHDERSVSVTVESVAHDIQPLFGLKFYSIEDIGTGFFIKLWLSDTNSINTDKPPHYILPIPSGTSDSTEIPCVLFPHDKDATEIYYSYQVISPGHTIISAEDHGVPLPAAATDTDVIEVAFRADRQDQLTTVLTGVSYLTGDTNAEDDHTVWAAVANGSFRISIDDVAYNIDGINFGAVGSMSDVAAAIQVAIRAATGSTETVAWSIYPRGHFVITTVKSVVNSITVTSTSTGTVGTDISGAGAADWMDCDIDNGIVTDASVDPYGRKLFYDTPIARFYLPLTQPMPESGNPKRQLTKLEFENYSPYTAWPVAGVDFDHIGGVTVILGSYQEEPPIGVGDQVVVTNSSNVAFLPNGTYITTAKYTWGSTGGPWYVKIHVTGGGPGKGTCDTDSNPASTVPRATIEIQPSNGELNTYTYGSFQLGQEYVANFPGVCYENSEPIDDYEFDEGTEYEIRLIRDSGGWPGFMQAVGNLRLHFEKA